MLHSRVWPVPRRNRPGPASSATDLRDEKLISEIDESPEDLFGTFLPHLFPDETPSLHGDPGQHLLYSSPRYGDLEIMVPSYPTINEKDSEETTQGLEEATESVNRVDEGRRLFAHFLWSAALVVAEGVENAHSIPMDSEPRTRKESREIWHVKGESVLELGAGAALPSLVCALSNASMVVATDHPASPALSGAIAFNTNYNLRNRSETTTVSIQPHEWGVLDGPFAQKHKGAFTRIIAADCYWIRAQHENLVRTMKWFLAPGGKVWVVAGFHTGRAIVAGFFQTAMENGFEIERIFERDLMAKMEDGEEVRREWVPVREGEGPENRGRWVVVAVLTRNERQIPTT